MQSRAVSAVIVVALVAVAVVLFVVLNDDDGDSDQAASGTTTTATITTQEKNEKPKPKPEITTIVVKGGEPVGGVQELDYTAGDEVRFEVEADVAEEVHVHGYDIMEDVSPGKPASFDFPADIEGGFAVELEGPHVQIAELAVQPG
jgi:heme/copper-type cytochrome/quinol oxidase subunit 2